MTDEASRLDIFNLQQWNDAWNKTYKSKLRTFYRFSPQYESLWESLWRKYDELEAVRLASSVPRFPWQVRIERYRADINDVRERLFKVVRPHNSPHFPLWIQYDRFCGIHDQDRRSHWKATSDNWSKFQDLYDKSENESVSDSHSSFRASLSWTQQSSYELLRDWWTANYCSKVLLEAVRSFLAQNRHSELPLPNPGSTKIMEAIMADQSYYHEMCFALFIREFNPLSWEPNISWNSLGMLSKSRFYASCLATAQCLSQNVLAPNETFYGREYPKIVPFTDLVRNDQPPTGKPRWLWDTVSQETIAVSELPFCPRYACISHTWGRWRKATSIKIKGVKEWLVPENDLYDVQKLSQKLSQLPFKYIWLDLFCIPQDGSISANEEINRQSTIFGGSDACIAWIHDVDSWDGVIDALEWLCLHYMRTLGETVSMADNLDKALSQAAINTECSLAFMHPGPNSFHLKQNFPSSTNISAKSRQQWEPSTWFSSLWTLQEAVLCPRMELYSKDWHRLEDRNGAALTLVSLAAFLHIAFAGRDGGIVTIFDIDSDPMNPRTFRKPNRGIQMSEESVPTAVSHLYDFLEMTRLNNVLLTSSPVSIIFNANVRRCTGDRAPAIMSAIGVTHWYSERLRERRVYLDCNEKLILGIYPLDFVREVFHKSGADFFETAFTIPRKLSEDNLKRKRPIGSMLPFSTAKGWLFRKFGPPEYGRIDAVNHSAVAEWVIQENGTVHMLSAGILTSTEVVDFPQVSGSLLCFEEDIDVEDGETNNFREKLKEISRGRTVHAVALYQDGPVQTGILLCQHEETREDGHSTYLIRIGVYWIMGQTVRPEMPSSTSVDWIVL